MREVYLDFGDGFVDVSHLVKYETLKYSQRAYNDSYRYAQNDCSFTLIYDELIFNQLYLGEAKVKIIKDSIPVFLGHTTPNKTKKYNGIVNISTYRIDAIDDLDYMEVEVGDIVYEDCKVLDPLNPTQSIIHKLANIAGWDNNRINSSVTIDTVIERFAPTSPEDLVLEVLNTLLYEYGYVLSLDANGNIEFHKWVFPSDTSYSVEFTEDNILLEIERKDSIKKYDSIKTYYYDIGFAEKVMLYRDSNCSYNADGTFKGVSVLNNTYYPFEANVIDETTGTNTIVEQEYTDESIRYFTNKAIKENLDYNYKAFSSDFSSMIATENHFLDSRYNSPMTVTHSFGNKKCQLLYHNTSGSSKDIWYSNVFGDVWYKSTERTCTIDIKDEVKDVYEYRSKYVFDKEVADRFTKALAALYKIGKVYYLFPSEADYAVGAVCRLVLKDTNVLAQIVEKTWNEDKEYWEYQIIQTSFEPLNITGTTTSVKVNVIPTGSFDFTTSSGQIIIPYTDNVSSFTNAIIELDVKRMGVSYLDDWTINAATTNCAGSFTSKGVYKISSVSSTAASITFTATNSFWGTLEKTVYISRASDEIGDPDTPTGLQAVVSESGISLSISAVASGSANVIQKVQWQIKKTSTWVDLIDLYDTNGVYVFNRSTDGYPEITTGSAPMNVWQVRARIMNMSGKTSMWSTAVSLNTSKYKTWLMNTPSIYATASGRSVDLKFYRENDFYGDSEFRVQIRKGTEAWKELGDSGNAYVSDDSYKGAGEYTISKYETYRQIVPLVGQKADLPQDTEYKYRVALYNLTTKVATAYSNEVLVLAKGTGVKDVVTGAIKNAQLDFEAVTHDKIAPRTIVTENLSVVARSKINTLSNPADGTTGWDTGTRFEDENGFGLELVAPNHRLNSDYFTVEPNEILKVSFGLQLVNSAGSTGKYGIHFGLTGMQVFKIHLWDKTSKKWIPTSTSTNSYFCVDYQGSEIEYVTTYILGSNVDLLDVPAPKTTTIGRPICLQLMQGDTSTQLRSGFNQVNNGYTWRLYTPLVVPINSSQIVAENILTDKLSAITANIGEITSGVLESEKNPAYQVPNVRLDLNNKEFWIGNDTYAENPNTESDNVEYLEFKNSSFRMKVKNFILTSISSVIKGLFQVVQKSSGATLFEVSEDTGNTKVFRNLEIGSTLSGVKRINIDQILTASYTVPDANYSYAKIATCAWSSRASFELGVSGSTVEETILIDFFNGNSLNAKVTANKSGHNASQGVHYIYCCGTAWRGDCDIWVAYKGVANYSYSFRLHISKAYGQVTPSFVFSSTEPSNIRNTTFIGDGNFGTGGSIDVAKKLTVGGQVLGVKPYSARASFTPIGNKITCAGLPSALGLEIGDVVRVLADIMTPGGNFVALGQTARYWRGVCQVNSDVYAWVSGGDIYKQTNATGNFVALGAGDRNWQGVCQVNSDVYACVFGDIYKQTNATGNFVALGAENRNWHGICQVNSDVYACVSVGDIYKQTNATGNFVALGQTTRNWRGVCQVNSDVYAWVSGGDIYKQTNATGNFVALGAGDRNWRGVCQVYSDVYACVFGGDIYKQTNATGNFVALGQTTRYWNGICQVNSDVYACVYNGDIYKQTGVKTGTYNKLHTVEGISGNVVTVNYEHASNRGNGSLKLINAHGVPSTFTRIAKWYNAPIGLGQEFVSPLFVLGATRKINPNRKSYGVLYVRSKSSYNWVNGSINTEGAGISFSYPDLTTGEAYYTIQLPLSIFVHVNTQNYSTYTYKELR